MKALIKKDFIVLIRQMKLVMIFIILFSLIPSNFQNNFAMLYSALVPYTLCAFDEKNKWDRMAKMMPYKASQIVTSKYIMGWILIFFSFIVSIIANVVNMLINNCIFDVIPLIIEIFIALAIINLSLPLIYRFGVEKARYVNLILVGFIVAIATLFDEKIMSLLTLPSWVFYPILIVFTAVTTYFSIKLTAKFYQHTEI